MSQKKADYTILEAAWLWDKKSDAQLPSNLSRQILSPAGEHFLERLEKLTKEAAIVASGINYEKGALIRQNEKPSVRLLQGWINKWVPQRNKLFNAHFEELSNEEKIGFKELFSQLGGNLITSGRPAQINPNAQFSIVDKIYGPLVSVFIESVVSQFDDYRSANIKQPLKGEPLALLASISGCAATLAITWPLFKRASLLLAVITAVGIWSLMKYRVPFRARQCLAWMVYSSNFRLSASAWLKYANFLNEGTPEFLLDEENAYFSREIISDFIEENKDIRKSKFADIAGLCWEDVTIKITDGQRAIVEINGVQKAFAPSDFGFTDGRKGDIPNKDWSFLENNVGHKVLEPPSDMGKRDAFKMKLSRLRTGLKKVINIDGDPIPYDSKTDKWSLAFILIKSTS